MDIKQILACLFNIITASILNCSSSIVIRKATDADLIDIIALDDRIAEDFFKTLYKKEAYAHLPYGKNTDQCLQKELEEEIKMFQVCISGNSDYQLLLACSQQAHDPIAGLIVFHCEDQDAMEIDLLLVDVSMRGKGIGTQLVKAALGECPNLKMCKVYPYRLENDATLSFYEKLGFVRQGVGPANKLNIHGVSYAVAYLHYQLILD